MSDLALSRPRSLMTTVRRRPLLLGSRRYSLTANLGRRNRPLATIQPQLALVQRMPIATPAQPARSTWPWRPSRMVWPGRPIAGGAETPAMEEADAWDWGPDPGPPLMGARAEEAIVQRFEVGTPPAPPPVVPRVTAQRPAPAGYPAEPRPAPAISPPVLAGEEPAEADMTAGELVRGSDLWRRMFPERPRLRDIIQAREAAKQRQGARRAAPPTIPERLPRTRTWEISPGQPGQPAVSPMPTFPVPPAAPDQPDDQPSAPAGESSVSGEPRPGEQTPVAEPPSPAGDESGITAPDDQGVELPPEAAGVPGPTAVGPMRSEPTEEPETDMGEPAARPQQPTALSSGPVQARPAARTQEERAIPTRAPEEPKVESIESQPALRKVAAGDLPLGQSPVRSTPEIDSAVVEPVASPSTEVPMAPVESPGAAVTRAGAEPPLPASLPRVTVPPPASEGGEPPAVTSGVSWSEEAPIPPLPTSRPTVTVAPAADEGGEPPAAIGGTSLSAAAPSPVQARPASRSGLPETAPTHVSPRPVVTEPAPIAAVDQPEALSGEPAPQPPAEPEAVRRRAIASPLEPARPPQTGVSGKMELEAEAVPAAEPDVAQADAEMPAPSLLSSLPAVKRTERPRTVQARRSRRAEIGAAPEVAESPPAGEADREPPAGAAEPLPPVGSPAARSPAYESGPIQGPPQVSAEPTLIRRIVAEPPTGRPVPESEPEQHPVRAEPVIQAEPHMEPGSPAARAVVSLQKPPAPELGRSSVSPVAKAKSDATPGPAGVAAGYPVMHRVRTEPPALPAQVAPGVGDAPAGAGSAMAPGLLPLPPWTAGRRPAAHQARTTGPEERSEPRSPGSDRPAEQAASLPLHIPARPAPAPVQRVESAATGVDQEPVEPAKQAPEESAEAEGPDLEELARKVYPYLRRRLGVERERIGRG